MMFSSYSWLCSQELLLLLLRGPYGMPEIETRLATCKKKTKLYPLYYH